MKKIILASASPRRKELLEQLGLLFETESSNCEEHIDSAAEPHELAKSLSLKKALAVAEKHRGSLIIAADTFIVLEGRILGKPHSEAEATEMLRTLNGKAHSVISGFTVLDTETHKVFSRSVETMVHMKRLTPEEIEVYVRSGEPLGKAGGYAIQGVGAVLVKKIEGDYFNVVGLPLSALAESLKEFGIQVL
jgi:septum formation protein